MKQYGIDRFEGEIAVLVDGEGHCVNIPREKLPANAMEGDLVAMQDGEYRVLNEATEGRRKEVSDLVDELFQ